MEKTISQEERIRRAEEIYYRRRSLNKSGIRVSSNSVNSSKVKISLFKKMALQLAICSVIYIIFYLIKNTNYIFSEDVISKTKELLSYDINFENVYAGISSFFENNKDKFIIPNENQEENTNQTDTQQEEKEVENNEIENKEQSNETVGGIGGAETNEIQEEKQEENQKSQMEKDAEYAKSKLKFAIPLKGSVTSRYGKRKATEIVSANHYGIDIGANKGTAIYASIEGTVTLVSSEGDYRKACRNYKWRYYDKICTLQ